MAKPLSVTAWVVLALLNCLATRNVEAQNFWMKPPTYPIQQGINPDQQQRPPTYPTQQGINPGQQQRPPTYPIQQGINPGQQQKPPTYPTQQGINPGQQERPPTYPIQQGINPGQQERPPTYPIQQGINPGQQERPPTYPIQQGINPGQQQKPPTYPTQQGINPGQQQRPPTYPIQQGINPGQQQKPPTYPTQQGINPGQQQRPPTYPTQQGINPGQQQRPPTYPTQQGINPGQQQRPPTYPIQQGINPGQQQRPPTYPIKQGINPDQQQKPPTYPIKQGINPGQQQRPPTYPIKQGINPDQQQRPPTYPKKTKITQRPEVQQQRPPTYLTPIIKPPPQQRPSYNQIYYDQTVQEPQITQQQAHQPRPPVTKDPNELGCEVDRSVRIPCGSPQISAAGCGAINCCFDGQECFFGKAVTIQCTRDAQFIVVVAKDATTPNIDLESISMLGGGQRCTHTDSNSEFAIYQFPVLDCGSVVMEVPGAVIYQNQMTSSFEIFRGDLGVITRDSQFQLLFECRFIGTSVETLVVEVFPIQEPPLPVAALGPIRVHMRLANGQCLTKGCNEEEAAYDSFYSEADYPVSKVLRDPVYVEVQLLEKTDPNLVLTLGHCWTTTSPNPHSLPQWDILIDGCPNRDDRYFSSLVPVGPFSGLDFPSHYRRFIFKMFTFVDSTTYLPMKELVYIHCSTSVCSASSGRSCEPSCFRKKRDTESTHQGLNEPKVVVSSGPVNMYVPPETSKE